MDYHAQNECCISTHAFVIIILALSAGATSMATKSTSDVKLIGSSQFAMYSYGKMSNLKVLHIRT